jgi:plastocyanin
VRGSHRLRAACAAAALAALGTAGALHAEDHVVVQRDKSFSQPEVTVHAGDRIVFKNEDSVSHNVFSRSPGSEFEVRAQLPGQETPVAFRTPGVAEVRCAIHPNMRLRVTVTPKE